jgi:anti-sigma B factor antagonist
VDAHQVLRDACACAEDLGAYSLGLGAPPTPARLSSHPRRHYARVVGVLDGASVTGLVRDDGTVAGNSDVVARVLRSSADAAPTATPLAATLALARACDSVVSVEVFRAGQRGAVPASVVMRLSNGEQAPFSVVEHEAGQDHLVVFFGELDLAGTPLAEGALVRAAGPTLVLDLSRLTFLDAAGLRVIVSAKERIESQGDKFSIQGASGIVRRIFDVTGLAHWLDD